MTPDEIEALFTRSDGSFLCARWGRPIAPIVFGVDDATLSVVKGAVEAVALLAGLDVIEVDPELGANLMIFFFRDWEELLDLPDLGRLIPDLEPLVARLTAAQANQYRIFRFDDAGAIKASFVFLRMDLHLSDVPAETLALNQIVQTVLLWSDTAFQDRSPLAQVVGETEGVGTVILRPDISELIRAAYDPTLPVCAQDASHALRMFARMPQG
ncbi:hypothetical protein OO012_17315 [Rhodobacteraceae bacterium KMM 6894]|nr:hypothetical protein [Rhodobacteraceae bacterium KMM 6894]